MDPAAKTVYVLLGSMSFLRGPGERLKGLFDVVLTLAVAGRAFRELLHPGPRPSLPEKVSAAMTVLVVDDNAVNRRVLTALVEKLGCDACTAGLFCSLQ